MFFSGNLHGDEWVGPVTLLNLVEMLVACSSDPKSHDFNPWVARLVNTRALVFLVVTNPQGYYNNERNEGGKAGIDPNRDFAYATGNCLRSNTAKAVNAVWKEHIFQLGVTFHGGMESITYEWGSPGQQTESVSPDDVSQQALSLLLRDVSGSLFGHDYTVGRTNDVVYPVEGGMEDWAYAGAPSPLQAPHPLSLSLSLFSH